VKFTSATQSELRFAERSLRESYPSCAQVQAFAGNRSDHPRRASLKSSWGM
jgi:hypothetical protein